MVSRNDIIRQAERRYADYLASVVTGSTFFPLSLTLGKSRRATDYEGRREELSRLRDSADELGFDIQWETVSDPRYGPHERPQSACFKDKGRYLAVLGRSTEAANFEKDVEQIRRAFPELHEWVAAHCKHVVQQHGRWHLLLRVVKWMLANPQSNLYLRQLPIPGIHTKFIEQHQLILDDLICTLAPVRREVPEGTFRTRHGLREEESTLRIRFLDNSLLQRCGLPTLVEDMALPISAMAKLPLTEITVFVVENLRNFLALPNHPGAVVFDGHGDAVTRLGQLPWLHNCTIHYWGDIDVRGFAILARLRCLLPHAQSFLMDKGTWDINSGFRVIDSSSTTPVLLDHLTAPERLVLTDCHSQVQRLEQEKVPMAQLEARMNDLAQQHPPSCPACS